MEKVAKITLIILLTLISPLGLISRHSFATRPLSSLCQFQGEVLAFQKIVKPEKGVEEYSLTIRLDLIESEELCSTFRDKSTITGGWYPPTAKLPSGKIYKEGQPEVNIKDVLKIGAIIKGEIDSYDLIIENVELVKDESDIKDGKTLIVTQEPHTSPVLIIGLLAVMAAGLLFLLFKKRL